MATMDYVIKITDNTSGTATLTSDPYDVRTYEIQAGQRDEKEVDNLLEVRLKDGSVTNNLDELRTLNDLLRKARERNIGHDRRVDPVYIEWQETAGGTVWRSEIKDAKADWIPEALEYGYWTGDTQFAELEFRRDNYWEGPEAQLGLTNPNGTANTSGLNVYNCDDGTGSAGSLLHNYVDIAGTAIEGDLFGATRLEITNTYNGGAQRLGQVWIGQNFTNPDTFNHWIEAEAASHSGTVITDSTYSGGTAIRLDVPDGSTTEILTWTLSSADLDAAEGGYYKALLRFENSPTPDLNIRYRLKIEYNVTELWKNELATLDSNNTTQVVDLATFQLPPWIPGLTSLASLELILETDQDTGANIAQAYDSIQITPVDGWRAYRRIGYGTPQNSRIVDDGINDDLYQDDGSGSDKIGIWLGYGRPIELKPGTDQRLYFQLHSIAGNTAEKDRSVTVKLYYRPRRFTL